MRARSSVPSRPTPYRQDRSRRKCGSVPGDGDDGGPVAVSRRRCSRPATSNRYVISTASPCSRRTGCIGATVTDSP